MNLKFLYTDDKTGMFSDTTLRTWLIFCLFFIYAIVFCSFHILNLFGTLHATVSKEVLESAQWLFDGLGFSALGGGSLYFMKRVNERKAGADVQSGSTGNATGGTQ